MGAQTKVLWHLMSTHTHQGITGRIISTNLESEYISHSSGSWNINMQVTNGQKHLYKTTKFQDLSVFLLLFEKKKDHCITTLFLHQNLSQSGVNFCIMYMKWKTTNSNVIQTSFVHAHYSFRSIDQIPVAMSSSQAASAS